MPAIEVLATAGSLSTLWNGTFAPPRTLVPMDDDDPGDWRPRRQQRVARWAMLFAVLAMLLVAVSGTVSIVFGR